MKLHPHRESSLLPFSISLHISTLGYTPCPPGGFSIRGYTPGGFNSLMPTLGITRPLLLSSASETLMISIDKGMLHIGHF